MTKSELDLLETVDVQLLRNILKAPKTTPKEILYLELGCIPFRELLRKRRIPFCQYILKQSPDSMMFKFLETQIKTRKPKDWISQVFLIEAKYITRVYSNNNKIQIEANLEWCSEKQSF